METHLAWLVIWLFAMVLLALLVSDSVQGFVDIFMKMILSLLLGGVIVAFYKALQWAFEVVGWASFV